MDDLISRSALRKALVSGIYPQSVVVTEAVALLDELLRDAPTIAAAPKSEVDRAYKAGYDTGYQHGGGKIAQVVHARWVFADDQYCRCTRCNQKAPVILQYQDEPETVATDYCPRCGARMDADAPERAEGGGK